MKCSHPSKRINMTLFKRPMDIHIMGEGKSPQQSMIIDERPHILNTIVDCILSQASPMMCDYM
jgi:hypothetical protein